MLTAAWEAAEPFVTPSRPMRQFGSEAAQFREAARDSATPDASEAGGITCEGLTAGRLLRHVATNERREVDPCHGGRVNKA